MAWLPLTSNNATLLGMCSQTMPIISALALFGTIAIVSCIIISLGPIAHVEQNSKTYSAIPPPRYRLSAHVSELHRHSWTFSPPGTACSRIELSPIPVMATAA